MKNIYKVETNLTEEENNRINDILDNSDLTLIETIAEDEEFDSFDVYDENDFIVSYFIANENQVEIIRKVLMKYEVKHAIRV